MKRIFATVTCLILVAPLAQAHDTEPATSPMEVPASYADDLKAFVGKFNIDGASCPIFVAEGETLKVKTVFVPARTLELRRLDNEEVLHRWYLGIFEAGIDSVEDEKFDGLVSDKVLSMTRSWWSLGLESQRESEVETLSLDAKGLRLKVSNRAGEIDAKKCLFFK